MLIEVITVYHRHIYSEFHRKFDKIQVSTNFFYFKKFSFKLIFSYVSHFKCQQFNDSAGKKSDKIRWSKFSFICGKNAKEKVVWISSHNFLLFLARNSTYQKFSCNFRSKFNTIFAIFTSNVLISFFNISVRDDNFQHFTL